MPDVRGGGSGLGERVVALSPDLVESVAFGVNHPELVCGNYWRRLEARLEEEVSRALPGGARMAGFDLDSDRMEVRVSYEAARATGREMR
jgi:hypothetical protein